MIKYGYLKDKQGNRCYPYPYYEVGDLYLTTNSENPNIRFGYGTWSLFGEGRTLVCVDTSDSDFNTVKKTGGEKRHRHITPLSWLENPRAIGVTNDFGMIARNGSFYGIYSDTSGGVNLNINNYYTDESMNLQPFITCYVWIRTA